MKKTGISVILLILSLSCFAAEYKEAPFLPLSPFILGQGGAFTADPGGYYSLFYNPAGYVNEEGQGLILPAASFWMYTNPGDSLCTNWSDAQAAVDFYDAQMKKGGYGYGGSIGAAFIDGGFGLGATLMVDSLFHGDRLAPAMDGYLNATFGLTAGYAFTLDFENSSLSLGFNLRPLYRINAILSSSDAEQIMNDFIDTVYDPSLNYDFFSSINSVPAVHGISVGFDAGAILDLGSLKIGLSIRDIGRTVFLYKASTIGNILSGLSSFQADTGSPVAGDLYYIPMNVSIGASWNIDFGVKKIFDPTVVLDIQDIVEAAVDNMSFWTLLHAGVNCRFFEGTFNVQAGINQGYLTFGMGAKASFAEFNAALFTRELGRNFGDIPNTGLAFDLILRF